MPLQGLIVVLLRVGAKRVTASWIQERNVYPSAWFRSEVCNMRIYHESLSAFTHVCVRLVSVYARATKAHVVCMSYGEAKFAVDQSSVDPEFL